MSSNTKEDREDGPINKISFLNTQINDIRNDVKLSVKNMITNVNEMQDLDSKSAQIKDTSFKFQQDAVTLERKIKCRNNLMKYSFYGFIALFAIYIIYKIFK